MSDKNPFDNLKGLSFESDPTSEFPIVNLQKNLTTPSSDEPTGTYKPTVANSPLPLEQDYKSLQEFDHSITSDPIFSIVDEDPVSNSRFPLYTILGCAFISIFLVGYILVSSPDDETVNQKASEVTTDLKISDVSDTPKISFIDEESETKAETIDYATKPTTTTKKYYNPTTTAQPSTTVDDVTTTTDEEEETTTTEEETTTTTTEEETTTTTTEEEEEVLPDV